MKPLKWRGWRGMQVGRCDTKTHIANLPREPLRSPVEPPGKAVQAGPETDRPHRNRGPDKTTEDRTRGNPARREQADGDAQTGRPTPNNTGRDGGRRNHNRTTGQHKNTGGGPAGQGGSRDHTGHAARCVVSDTTISARGQSPRCIPVQNRRVRAIAIYSLNLSSVGKTTHAPRTAGANIRYITRPSAAPLIQSARMPADPRAARSWLDAQERADRKNARVIDKIIIALPRELDRPDWQRLVRAFAEDVSAGRASWLSAIHAAGPDANNPHAHLILRDRDPETGRRVAKLSDKGAVHRVRALWERHCNRALKAAGRPERIDRRSHAARGLKTPPQRHRGPYRPMKGDGASILHDRQPGDATGQSGRLGAVSDKGDHLVPLAVAGDDHVVFRERLARGDVLEVRAELAHPPGQAGALEERFHAKGEQRCVGPIGNAFTGHPVKPPFDAARQREVVWMNREDITLPQNSVVQPRRQLDLPRFGRVGVPVRSVRGHHRQAVAFGDAVVGQPREGPFFPGAVVIADVRDDGGHAQPTDGACQLLVVPPARASPDLAEGVMRREPDARGWFAAAFNRLVQMGRREDNQIPVPHGCNRIADIGCNTEMDILVPVLNRLRTAFLEGQKRIFHHVPIVAQRRIERGHREHVELDNLSHARSVTPAPIPR